MKGITGFQIFVDVLQLVLSVVLFLEWLALMILLLYLTGYAIVVKHVF